ncbi:RE2 [Symbiodinium sp. CCMP2592]|nr:RE2 [Symbiodinium sp. CCMP2592]
MAFSGAGASNPTSYYSNAPATDQSDQTARAQDQGDGRVWDDSSWNRGDQWAWQGWYRPYGYRYHWSWGSKAEWSTDGGDFSSGSPGEGDDDQGSGGRQDEHPSHELRSSEGENAGYNRRASWNSSGKWAGDSSTGISNSQDDGNLGSEATATKGSFNERMAVPGFDAQSSGEELGMSARSYLRQVDAWCKVTRTPKHQQALLLYQNLSGRAWVESEELSVEDLSGNNGVSIFRAWIQERYQEVEVSKIAESLTAFFKRLRRQSGQTIREFNSAFDRSHSRLLEIDCRLPEVAKAWAYLNALSLSSSEELALLASVGNEYNVTKLQRAAVLHEKSLRPPWQPRKGPYQDIGGKGQKGVKASYMTGVDEVDEDEEVYQGADDEVLAEEEAVAMHEAYVAQETAKARYREVSKARGVDPSVLRKGVSENPGKSNIEERLAQAKARSFCAGCGRRGHWHKDSTCPLNKPENQQLGNKGNVPKSGGDQQAHVTSSSGDGSGSVVQVAYEVGYPSGNKLYAITDTACSKSVMGQGWLESYLKLARNAGLETQFVNASDDFRFGASKLFRATYTATILIEVGGKPFAVRASVVEGEVPLLLSRKVLSVLGMVYDVDENTARFKHLGVDNIMLSTTDNGHPALIVNPRVGHNPKLPSPQEWADDEVKLLPLARKQYTVHTSLMTSSHDLEVEHQYVGGGVDSKLPSRGPLASDFWIETPSAFVSAPRQFHVGVRMRYIKCMTHGEGKRVHNIQFYGSAGLFSPELPVALLLKIPSRILRLLLLKMASSSETTGNVWHMTKAQLISKAMGMGITIHQSWSVGEIRQLIQEKKKAMGEISEVPKGLASMNKAQLLEQCRLLEIEVPEKATNGHLTLLIRDCCTRNKGDAVVSFGRHRGKLFREVPQSYLRWALAEVKERGPEGSSPDLVSLSRFAAQVLQEVPEVNNKDPEMNSMVPVPQDVESVVSWGSEGWSELSPEARKLNSQANSRQVSMAAPKSAMRSPSVKRTTDHQGEPGKAMMNQDVPPEVKKEIDELMAKVASLKDEDLQSEPDFEVKTQEIHVLPGVRDVEIASGEVFYECRNGDFSTDAGVTKVSSEHRARDLLRRKDFSFEACEGLLIDVCEHCQASRKRKIMDGTCSVAFGAYSHGNHYGVIRRTYQHWYVTKYVNAFMRFHGAKGQWSSVQLCFNCHVGPHKDVHNLGDNWTISFGDFEGGRLWLEHNDPTKVPDAIESREAILADGSKAIGCLVDTRHNMYKFCPKRKHAVEQWTGNRCSIIAYVTRGIGELSRPERDVLRSSGFPLGRSEGACAWEKEHETRPKKSIRKNLWKGARRASSLLTLSLAAASSFISENIPFGKPPHQACLFEIGGNELTLDMIEAGFQAIEPLSWGDYVDTNHALKVTDVINNLKPNVVWFQGCDESNNFIEQIVATAGQQLEHGGSVVYHADKNDHVWENRIMKCFMNENAHLLEDQGEAWLLRVGGVLHDTGDSGGECGNLEHEAHVVSHDDKKDRHEPLGASAIHFNKNVPKHVQAALTRLHQNLGHPKITDLVRHLRFAGADDEVIKACKGMRCEVCDRNQRTGSARPGVLPSLLDMNQVVSVDVFSVFDSDRVRHEFLSIIDHATTFHLVCELEGHSGEDFCRQFTQLWGNVFGAPGTISADLESGLQLGVSKYAEFHGCRVRSSAGQAHWQQGVIERHGYWYQEILQRVIDEKSITSDDMYMAVQAVNSAKNELRRRHGFSPTQAVFGKDPRAPEELESGVDEERFIEIMSGDQRRQREVSIRASARMAFFRTQIDSKFRRGMIQRARVKRGGYAVGELVCFYRIEKIATKRGQWRGPGTIIGHEGGNWWVSFGGRCHLVAEEHLRPATSEELGELFSTRIVRDDLEKLLELDPDDPDTYQPPDEEIPEFEDPFQEFPNNDLEDMDYEPSLPEEDGQDMVVDDDVRGAKRDGDPSDVPPVVSRRVRRKGQGVRVHSANMLKRCQTERALEKQLEKEIPWKLVPPEEHAAFRAAELKQTKEHYEHDALEPLSVEESAEVYDRVHSSRILSSRFAYRDKHWSRRKIDASVPWKHKARLVVSGHRDPDIQHLETDAPTIGRLTVLTLLQIVASRRSKLGWMASAGDITAAFLNGDPLERELYLRQPRGGVEGLLPEQLFRVKKGIFGLPDSPRKWWRRLRRDMLSIKIDFQGLTLRFTQCPLDPCLFQLCDPESGKPLAYVGVHVDDLLTVGPRDLVGCIKSSLSAVFPVDDWEDDMFEYIGSHVKVSEEGVFVGQESYASSRLFEVEVQKGQDELEQATEAQRVDNQSLIGALSWLSAQSRPDLQCSVSLAQQLQKTPTVEDIKFTNKIAKRAWEHRDKGIWLRPLDLSSLEYLVYHDSAWANALLEGEEHFILSPEDHEKGTMKEGPFDRKARKAKKENSKVASQMGILIALVDANGFKSGGGEASIIDWKSTANPRVCRSTFAAETTACSEAVEMGQYVRSFVESVLHGSLKKINDVAGSKLRCLTDCKSLYDHLHREGVPRVPSDKRLAIDLAALRQTFDLERVRDRIPLYWVPTEFQLADILTKPKSPDGWWDTICSCIRLPFVKRVGETSE